MAPTVTEIDDRLTRAVHELGQKVERQGERLAAIEESLGWVKKIGGFFATIGILIFSALVSLTWNASALNSEVKQQEVRLDKIDDKLKQQDARFDKMDQKFDKMDQKLDQLIRQTAQGAVPRPKPGSDSGPSLQPGL